MKTGPIGIGLIKKFEGLRLKAYQDIVGVWTIGYGDTLGVYPGMTITEEQAETRLYQRLADEFEPAINGACAGTPTTQEQYDAMASLAWNIGDGRFAHSSIARLHHAGDYAAAADAFRLYNKAGGRVVKPLANRREAERKVYLSGKQPVADQEDAQEDAQDDAQDDAQEDTAAPGIMQRLASVWTSARSKLGGKPS